MRITKRPKRHENTRRIFHVQKRRGSQAEGAVISNFLPRSRSGGLRDEKALLYDYQRWHRHHIFTRNNINVYEPSPQTKLRKPMPSLDAQEAKTLSPLRSLFVNGSANNLIREKILLTKKRILTFECHNIA